ARQLAPHARPRGRRHRRRPMTAADDGLLVAAGRLWDGTGAPARPDTALLCRGGRIERMAPAAAFADWTGPRLDARDRTVIPGLMDLHVHLVSVVDPDEPN